MARVEVPGALGDQAVHVETAEHSTVVLVVLLGETPGVCRPPSRWQVPAVSGPVLVLQVAEKVGARNVPVLVVIPGCHHGVEQANGAVREVNLGADPVARSDVDGDEQQPQLKQVPRGGVRPQRRTAS